jgi:hypothetical protein
MGNLRFSGRWNALHLHRFYHRFRSFSRAFPGPMWQTKAIMLIEIWERLRGYDKWVQTEAKVESSQVEETVHSTRYGIVYSYASGDILIWTDRQGEKQYADFSVPEDSPLYQLVGGETVTIRYDPAKPERFYFRELMKTRVHTLFQRTIASLIFIGIFLLLSWFSWVTRK